MNYVVMDIGVSSIKHSVVNENEKFIQNEVEPTPIQGKNKTTPFY
ncbi:hypothetical protein [Rossellomorea sp. BNER]